jgi:hypothetical protein
MYFDVHLFHQPLLALVEKAYVPGERCIMTTKQSLSANTRAVDIRPG